MRLTLNCVKTSICSSFTISIRVYLQLMYYIFKLKNTSNEYEKATVIIEQAIFKFVYNIFQRKYHHR